MDASPAVGDHILIEWPTTTGVDTEFEAEICSIGKSSNGKQNYSFKFLGIANQSNEEKKRKLVCDWDSECPPIRKSRLLNKKWSLIRPDKILLPLHRLILAPMVGGSELAFRLLCRKYGTQLAYTPMLNSERFAVDSEYRSSHFQTTPEDRPLVAHFSANNPDVLVKAAKFVERDCDAIDLNLGCPQRIAFTGHFGSYLLDEEDRPLVLSMVSALSKAISVPVFVKIRLLDQVEDTIRLVSQLIESGASLIAIHGRYRVNLVGRSGPGARDGLAHLDQIAEVKKHVAEHYGNFPIIANGNIQNWDHVKANLIETQAEGVMSAEGLLDNPALFYPACYEDIEQCIHAKELPIYPKPEREFQMPSKLQLAREYLDLVKQYPVPLKSVIFHTRRMCRDEFTRYQLLESCVGAISLEEVFEIVEKAAGYEDGSRDFQFDKNKAKDEALAAKRRKENESKRKLYEARMLRKAKREGKDPDYYLKLGAELPTVEELIELKRLPKEEAFAIWKEKHCQHCYDYHFKDGCPRERSCAFLHADPTYAEAEVFG